MNKKHTKMRFGITLSVCAAMLIQPYVYAFREFQKFIEDNSNKQINCIYCHIHPNGPEGHEKGQLGSLSNKAKSLTIYNQYLEGQSNYARSPILNKFGNHLASKLSYDLLIDAQDDPKLLIEPLKQSDLDKDGISDADELLDGTLPYDRLDGAPHKLFAKNIKIYWSDILCETVLIILIIIALLKVKSFIKKH